MKRSKRNLIWLLLFPILAVLTVWGLVSSSRTFSLSTFRRYLSGMSPYWLAVAVAAMLTHVVLEGKSLQFICKRLGYPPRPGQGLSWAATDIVFSAITPSATGGQPAAAVLMIRHGIPGAVCTVALLLNLIFYTLSILVIGAVVIVLRPGILASFRPFSQVLILLGVVIQLTLSVFFILLLRGKLIRRIAAWGVRAMYRLRLIRDLPKWQRKTDEKLSVYRTCTKAVGKDRGPVLGVFLLNIFQRLALLLVPVCIYLGTGGSLKMAPTALAAQACVILGSSFVPMPGAMGVADYLFIDGYAILSSDLVSMDLLSRGISFYGCFLLCGLVILIGQILNGLQKRRKKT